MMCALPGRKTDKPLGEALSLPGMRGGGHLVARFKLRIKVVE
jgi:hypothetical protein